MKCKGCDANIRENLELLEEVYGERSTKILGIELDPENFVDAGYNGEVYNEDNFQILLSVFSDEDIGFNFTSYQCLKCHTDYTRDEVKEIFK
jgi:hypothetical protein